MSSSVSTCTTGPLVAGAVVAVAGRFQDLAATLVRNAAILGASGLPESMVSVRATVYRDVATQARMLADSAAAPATGDPLVVTLSEHETAVLVARRFEWLAGQLVANARLLAARTRDAVMQRRAAVYRDVATQVRMLARYEVEQAEARMPSTTRPPMSTALAKPNPIAAKAATRAPRVRPAFLEDLVDAIAHRRRQGWSVARLTLWLRSALRDPQTDAIHPCAERKFVSYVTGLLAGATARPALIGVA